MTERRAAEAPVGVFDSGVGGLTVLAMLTQTMPAEDFVYMGDTARRPYGTRSTDSIRRYSLQAAARLHDSEVKCLVACYTASAIARDALAHEFAPAPVRGVLEPGAVAACRVTRTGRIAVIATTESTVRGGAYEAAKRYERPTAVVSARACAFLVTLPGVRTAHCPHAGSGRNHRRLRGNDRGRSGARSMPQSSCVQPRHWNGAVARDGRRRTIRAHWRDVPRPKARGLGHRDRRSGHGPANSAILSASSGPSAPSRASS